jgi:hypothetical protein
LNFGENGLAAIMLCGFAVALGFVQSPHLELRPCLPLSPWPNDGHGATRRHAPRAAVALAVSVAEAEALDSAGLLALWTTPRETAAWSELDWERVYRSAERRGLLPGFGSVSGLIPVDVSVGELERRAGLPLVALAPKETGSQWILLGMGVFAVELLLAKTVGLESVLVRTLPAFFVLFAADQLLLSQRLSLALVLWLRPEYGEKLARHEAGHFLVAYLCGLPLTGYFLAGNSQAAGQAGTIFLDTELYAQLSRGELRQSTLARYSTILMSGIAAEAICFGSAEGGYADEQALVEMLSSLRPPWQPQRIDSLARWSALNAVEMIRAYKPEHDALAARMAAGAPLGECLRVLVTGCAARQRVRDGVSP